MNKEESLALFAKGKEAWNEWAEKMLAERETLKAAGNWVESEYPNDWNDETRAWHDLAKADFSTYVINGADFRGSVFPSSAGFVGAHFQGDARFDGAQFQGDARFDGASFQNGAWFGNATFRGGVAFVEATFDGNAAFDGATFKGNAGFGGATFGNDARFGWTTFGGNAWFEAATFNKHAGFEGAIFENNVGFRQAVFAGYTNFQGAKFEKSTTFLAMRGESAFTLAGATFRRVPNFEQAHFEEAPRLDNIHIEAWRSKLFTLARCKEVLARIIDSLARLKKTFDFKGHSNRAASWRALNRLAIQGHDHARELALFKAELKARRWIVDKPWTTLFWFGVLYQVLSDFGRSLLRPLLWWGLSVPVFANLYVGQHPTLARNGVSGFGWAAKRLTGLGGEAPPLSCVAGDGEAWIAALGLSLRKGLLFLGGGASEKLKQTYGCLYGLNTNQDFGPGELPGAFTPVIPDPVAFLGLVQLLLSSVLIFLFLLALRNHFRIK